MAYSPSIQKLIEQFSEFPTVGPRTAARFVFYLLKLSQKEVEEVLNAIAGLRQKVKLCSLCFKPFEPFDTTQGKSKLCEVCSSPSRDKTLLCVVEKEADLETIEKTKKYLGRYFILGGTVSKLKNQDLKNLRTNELLGRVKSSEVREIIIATNATTEGEATALYLERVLKPLTCGEPGRTKKITRLGRGLPTGGELEYADEETLSSALDNRK